MSSFHGHNLDVFLAAHHQPLVQAAVFSEEALINRLCITCSAPDSRTDTVGSWWRIQHELLQMFPSGVGGGQNRAKQTANQKITYIHLVARNATPKESFSVSGQETVCQQVSPQRRYVKVVNTACYCCPPVANKTAHTGYRTILYSCHSLYRKVMLYSFCIHIYVHSKLYTYIFHLPHVY